MRALRYLFEVTVVAAIIVAILVGGGSIIGAILSPSWVDNWFIFVAAWFLYDPVRDTLFRRRRSGITVEGKPLDPRKRYRFKDWSPPDRDAESWDRSK